MPKGNPGRLKSRFEIRGELTPNEYEFQQHQGEMAEQEHEIFPPAEEQEGASEVSSMSQGREAARIAELEARAHKIAERRRANQSKSASSAAKGSKGKTAKKAAGKKQSAPKKSRSASQSRGATKSATKSATKKASGKSGAIKSGKKRAGKSAQQRSSKKSAKRR